MWNCELKTRLSDIVSHLRNNYRQILTQPTAKKVFHNVILKCFQDHLKWAGGSSLFCTELQILGEAWKTSFARDNEKTRRSCEHGPENGKPKSNQTKRRSDNGGSTRVDCHIYRRRNKYLQRRHGPWKHEKEYAAWNRPESWYLQKHKTELNLNSMSKEFQGSYLILIATLNFQRFRLDTLFLSVLPPKR